MKLGATLVLALAPLVLGSINTALAGPSGGAKGTVEAVQAYNTDVYNVWFTGGELASVLVWGDHDTDLDLYVYDHN